ncbi:MAG: SGNH/GDSL hydrolase family protein [Lachnospiraceae bacterium]|nr:SGNH/GDSL hydrolase family protein [Lachnospiraceae bacterium]
MYEKTENLPKINRVVLEKHDEAISDIVNGYAFDTDLLKTVTFVTGYANGTSLYSSRNGCRTTFCFIGDAKYIFVNSDTLVKGYFYSDADPTTMIKSITNGINAVPSNARYVILNTKYQLDGTEQLYVCDESGVMVENSDSKKKTLDIEFDMKHYYSGGILKGKNVAFLGDSMTAGVGSTNPYPELMRDMFGCLTANHGLGGALICTEPNQTYRSINEIADDLSEYTEVIVCVGGTNDYYYSTAPLGNLGDTENGASFYGAVYALCLKLRTNHPNAEIFFGTPFHRREETHNGRNLSDYVKAVKEVCALFSIPVIDLYGESGIEYVTGATKYFYDSVHLNDTGYIREAKLIGRFIAQHLVG